mmetsp:Transcript_13424/g.34380  ORF Transcript_13424/g.34380 Transcript_13424/m.34380 type:complete len:490 (+) Transcript_13424:114-1583(+)
MHFSIPETRELFRDRANKAGQYTVYHLHCNGVFHCYFRYSQAFQLNEDLRKAGLRHPALGYFPPKRLLALSTHQVVERREALEAWFQQVGQDPAISRSLEFREFLLNQQDEVKLCCEEVEITVYLVNKKCISIKALSTDQTDVVLEAVCSEIGVARELTYYFGLYLVKEDAKRFSIIRPLQDFECPHISLGRYRDTAGPDSEADGDYKIQLRKAFWDTALDKDFLGDKVATNLVYIQAVEDVRLKHLDMTDEHREQLAQYREAGEKAKFVKLCGEIPGYCFYRWKHCLIDYPEKNTKVMASIGPYELRVRNEATGEDFSFSVTRMRCWKIASDAPSSADDVAGGDDMNADDAAESKLSLSFDYLFAKDRLQWVTLRSKHAIVISMLLQSVVDEIVRKNLKQPIRVPADSPEKAKPQLRPRAEVDPDASPLRPSVASGEGTAGWALGGEGGAAAAAPAKPSTSWGGGNAAFDAEGEENTKTFGAIGDDDL